MKWLSAVFVVALLAWLLIRATKTSPQWEVARGGTVTGVALSLAADEPVRGWTRQALPQLTITCTNGLIGLTLFTGLPVEVERTRTRSVSVQIDDGPSAVHQWEISSDRRVMIAPADDASQIVRRLSSAARLTLAFVPLRAEPVEARFSVEAFDRVWSKEGSSCL